jgi:hypothetical protein
LNRFGPFSVGCAVVNESEVLRGDLVQNGGERVHHLFRAVLAHRFERPWEAVFSAMYRSGNFRRSSMLRMIDGTAAQPRDSRSLNACCSVSRFIVFSISAATRASIGSATLRDLDGCPADAREMVAIMAAMTSKAVYLDLMFCPTDGSRVPAARPVPGD